MSKGRASKECTDLLAGCYLQKTAGDFKARLVHAALSRNMLCQLYQPAAARWEAGRVVLTKLLFDAASPPLEHALLDVMGHKLSNIH